MALALPRLIGGEFTKSYTLSPKESRCKGTVTKVILWRTLADGAARCAVCDGAKTPDSCTLPVLHRTEVS
jgi:hypothetical protein